MALKKITNLNEGPMDYLRGAAKRVVPAIKQVHQAGQQTSLNANFTKALNQLVQLVKQVQPNKPAAQPAAQPARPQYGQPGTPVNNATQQMPTRPQMTFSSFMQAVDGEQLDEGMADFLKGAAGAVGQKVADKVKSYTAQGKSTLADIWAAGRDASEAGEGQRQNQQLQQQVVAVKKLMQQLKLNRNQALRAIATAAKPAGVDGNYIAKLLGLAAQPAAQPAAQGAPVATSTRLPSPQMRSPNPTGRKGYH